MIPIEHFREQQQRARLIVRRILTAVDRHVAGEDSTLIVLDIARLSGMLVIHCGQVDRVLRARFEERPSHDARLAACRFRQEFGGLVDLSRLFHRRWSSSKAIARDPIAFRVDVHQFVYAIEERFEREDEMLGLEQSIACEAVELVERPRRPPIRAAS